MQLLLRATLAFAAMPAFSCLWCSSTHAQGSKQDYARAEGLASLTANKVFRDRIEPRWIEGKQQFWYRVRIAPDAHEFTFVDAAIGERRAAFDHAQLAAALSESVDQEFTADKLPFRTIHFEDDGKALHFSAAGKRWSFDLAKSKLRELESGEAGDESTVVELASPRPSRDGGGETALVFINRTEARVRLFWIDGAGDRQPYGTLEAGGEREQHTYAGHVWLATNEGGRPLAVFEAAADGGQAVIDGSPPVRGPRRGPGAPRRIRSGASPDGKSPDGRWQAFIQDFNLHLRDVATGEEFALSLGGREADYFRDRVFWSPDSRRLVAMQEQPGETRKVHLIESSPRDQLQPKLHEQEYAKPGDRIARPRPRLFDVDGRREIPVDDKLFANPWSIDDVRWRADSSRFTLLYNQRGHQVLRVVAVDAASGAASPLVDERSETFIDYAHKQFLHWLDEANELIWMSERDGWNHLYLYDARTGQVKNQITQGPWVVRGVDRVDEEGRQVWFRAGGIRPEQDPYFIHFCRVNFDGSGLVVLTEGDGSHEIEYSPDGEYCIDHYSRVDLPPVSELRRAADGSLVCELERGDWSALMQTGWRAPQPFAAKGRDGETDVYGVIIRPSNFREGGKYPVIEQIYAGPQSAYVPKRFAAFHGPQALAELGFIVVQIDGMGTSHRSKKFHDVCAKNLADAGFPDRIAWLKAAARMHPEMDLSRVGVYGGSAGGQNALGALLFHGDFYHAAAADCGCHDNRMDKIWWNELWMGWPLGAHYEQQSNVTNAHKLQGKLLLIVGELDRNVDPASTMQVVDALVRADKDFELLVLPGAGHGAGGGSYGTRRQRDFFVRHLLGKEPRWGE